MKKLILLMLVLALSLAAISSCKSNAGGGNDNGGNNNPSTGDVEDAIWSSDITLGIVLEQGTTWDAIAFYDELCALIDSVPDFVSENADPYDHEFVFGNTTRQVSQMAYKMLDRQLTGVSGEIAWLIYSNGKSVGIAFNSELGMRFAADYIKENFLTQKTLKLPAGVVAYDVVDVAEYATEYREAAREEGFRRLEEELGHEITNEIRKLYALYTDDVYVWMANLYDPEIGGFYYSNSGRDNEGYLPDIESTVQALSHLASGGMFEEYGNSYAKGVSAEMREQLVAFAKSLQSPVDGFFYHPQWGTDIIAARRGRDLGWASQMLEAFGEKPLYNTPGGMKGTLGAPPGAEPVSSLTGRLGTSAVAAVSKVISTASNLPAYLRSLEAWATYIDSLNIPNDSYVAGNTLAAQHNEIKAAGQDYVDYLINYLNETQIPDLGLWEEIKPGKDTDADPTDRVNYANVNGLMKIASVYQYYNVPVPNLENALRSCIKVALYPNDEGDAHVCNTYNPWVIMSIVLNGAKQSEGDERVAELRAIIMENAVDLIAATVDKLIPHIREDGCFSYFEKALSHASQKALVACSPTIESDVNATAICTTGISGNMFSALGVKKVPLYYAPDRYHFYSIIDELDGVIKNEALPVETITFDGLYEGDTEYGSVVDPDIAMSVKGHDTTLDGNKYKYNAAEVVADPITGSNDDKALKMSNFTYLNSDGTTDISKTAMAVYTTITNGSILGNMYSFSADFLVDSSTANGYFMQLFFTRSAEDPSNSLGLNFYAYTKNGKRYVKISDGYDGPDGVRNANIVSDIPIGEWFNFKVDVYKIYEELEDGATGKTLNIIAKIYINGEFVGTSEASYTSSANPTVVQDKTIRAISLATYRFTSSVVYVDNIRAEKFDKQYEETVLPPEPAPEFVATPEGDRGEGVYYNGCKGGELLGITYDYNNGEKKPMLSADTEGKTYIAGLAEDGAGDGYVFFYRTGGSSTHEYTTHPFGTNTIPDGVENPVIIVEMDMAFGNIDKNLPIMLRFNANGIRQNVYFTMKKDGLGFDFAAEDSKFVPLEQNKWYNFVFETYLINPDAPINNANVRTKVYINGEFSIELSGVDVSSISSSSLMIQMQYTDPDSWICYDNIYLGYTEKEYVEAKEDAPEGMPTISGSIGNGEYYNGEYVGSRHDYDNGELKPTVTNGPSYGKTYLSDDEKRSVFFYKHLSPGTTANGQCGIQYSYPTRPESAKAIVFEADMAFSGFSNYTSETKAAGMQLSFVYNKWLASFFLAHVNGKITISSTTVKDGVNISLDEDTWYNLRFVVYMGNADTKTLAKVYVNGEYVGTMTPGDDKTTGNGNKVEILLRQFETDDWVVYDNLYIGFTDEAYVAPDAGEDPDEGGTDTPVDPPKPEEPETPAEPEIIAPTINGDKGQGVYYNGTDEGKRIDLGATSAPDVGKLAVSAIINKDFLYAAKKVDEGATNGQSNTPKHRFLTAPDGTVGYVVELDIAFGALSAVNVQLDVGMNGNYGSLYFGATDADSPVTFNWGKVSAGENIALTQGKWYNLLIVAYEIDGIVNFKIYVDGEYACDVISADKNKKSDYDYVTLTLRQLDTDNWVAMDNLYLGHTSEKYVYGDPDSYVAAPETVSGAENKGKGEYYNSDAAGKRLDGTSAADFLVSEIGDDAELGLTKDGEIIFYKNVTGTQGKSYIRINLPTKPTDAKAAVIEFDMVVGETMSHTNAGLVFMVETLGIRGDVFVKGDGEVASSAHPTLVTAGSNMSLAQGEWHNFRILVYDVDGVMYFKVYIDGEFVMDIRTANGTKTSSSNRLTIYMQEYDSAGDDYFLFDNIYLGYTDIEYVKGE